MSPAFSVTSPWSYVFNFVWVGWSSGGLHFDEMDNILSQVRGSKEIVVFPAESTCRQRREPLSRVQREGSLVKRDAREVPTGSQGALLPHQISCRRCGPNPKRCVPRSARNSHDSTSVNSFLAPALTRSSWPNSRYGRMFTAGGLWRYSGAWLGYLMKWFSLTLVKERAYGYY